MALSQSMPHAVAALKLLQVTLGLGWVQHVYMVLRSPGHRYVVKMLLFAQVLLRVEVRWCII